MDLIELYRRAQKARIRPLSVALREEWASIRRDLEESKKHIEVIEKIVEEEDNGE